VTSIAASAGVMRASSFGVLSCSTAARPVALSTGQASRLNTCTAAGASAVVTWWPMSRNWAATLAMRWSMTGSTGLPAMRGQCAMRSGCGAGRPSRSSERSVGAITCSRRTASAVLRAMGPITSRPGSISGRPCARGTMPHEGFRPTRPV